MALPSAFVSSFSLALRQSRASRPPALLHSSALEIAGGISPPPLLLSRPITSVSKIRGPDLLNFGTQITWEAQRLQRASKLTLIRTRSGSQFSVNSVDTPGSSFTTSDKDADSIPMPIVLIDQDSDSSATIVQLSFGDRLGALIDTMKALKDLGLDVTKGTVLTEASITQTKFYITRVGRKVEDPDTLERIRLTVISNLLKYHPECSERLAMGEAFGIKAPAKKLDIDIATHILVKDDGPKRSLLCIETADRPGLLLEMIKILSDININVESAEIETEGLVAKDKFHVSYRGAALNKSLSEVLINCLRYYLRRPDTDEDSY